MQCFRISDSYWSTGPRRRVVHIICILKYCFLPSEQRGVPSHINDFGSLHRLTEESFPVHTLPSIISDLYGSPVISSLPSLKSRKSYYGRNTKHLQYLMRTRTCDWAELWCSLLHAREFWGYANSFISPAMWQWYATAILTFIWPARKGFKLAKSSVYHHAFNAPCNVTGLICGDDER